MKSAHELLPDQLKDKYRKVLILEVKYIHQSYNGGPEELAGLHVVYLYKCKVYLDGYELIVANHYGDINVLNQEICGEEINYDEWRNEHGE